VPCQPFGFQFHRRIVAHKALFLLECGQGKRLVPLER